MAENQDSHSIINLLQQVNAEQAAQVWVPSIDKTIQLRQMTAKHQKDVVRTLASTKFLPTAMSITLYDIINDTLMTPDIDVDKFTAADKLVLMMAIRAWNMSDKIDLVNVVDKDGEPAEGVEKAISLTDHLTKLRKDGVTQPKAFKLSVPDIDIRVCAPTIGTEYKFEKYVYDVYRVNEDASPQDLITTAFVNTVAQFIVDVTVKGQTMAFADFTPEECINIVQQLPRRLIQSINDSMSDTTAVIKALTTHSFTHQKNKYAGQIPIDGTFFVGGD